MLDLFTSFSSLSSSSDGEEMDFLTSNKSGMGAGTGLSSDDPIYIDFGLDGISDRMTLPSVGGEISILQTINIVDQITREKEREKREEGKGEERREKEREVLKEEASSTWWSIITPHHAAPATSFPSSAFSFTSPLSAPSTTSNPSTAPFIRLPPECSVFKKAQRHTLSLPEPIWMHKVLESSYLIPQEKD
ncbi:hypothetical protein BDP27DRAFT_1435233 [Rhodocollybia butyracea]|uniref:Uncharacterized protein n=1 Tax=Rhodocollybia butyracea TaxID=206335 RepID=A0A9P5P7F9_9AGAR|nr:hypothetical protein BDP27DRAFT_1435233 [Rhodocollybia butyracea]